MRQIERDAKGFGAVKAAEQDQARQRVAARLLCGLDLAEMVEAPADRRAILVRRLERLMERERLKGARRHWSYDLNRHIALKQVLDRLRGTGASTGPTPAPRQERRRKTP